MKKLPYFYSIVTPFGVKHELLPPIDDAVDTIKAKYPEAKVEPFMQRGEWVVNGSLYSDYQMRSAAFRLKGKYASHQ